MENSWYVEIWGVRGSAPMAYREYLEYGGNTSCFLVRCGEEIVIFDAGSGLSQLGKKLSAEGRKRIHILLSHLHMDHICGLFGFPLFPDREAEIHLYGSAGPGCGLAETLRGLLGSPCWPLEPADFPAKVEIHEVTPGESFLLKGSGRQRGGLRVDTFPGNHPGGSLLYRLGDGTKSIVYGLDCELDEKMREGFPEFSGKTDLLIWDANFVEEDRERFRGWGHSSWRQGIEIGRAAEAKRVLMTHYSREYRDEFLQRQQREAERESDNCLFAKEGMVLRV